MKQEETMLEGVEFASAKPVKDDGKIRILWLEDNWQELVPFAGMQDYEKWFVIGCAEGPTAIETELAKEFSKKECFLPADVYLTDFRLCHNRDNCTDKAHLEIGLHAPSAGLLLGIFTVMRRPSFPQLIIPYSGFKEEYGQIWELAKRFTPDGLQVAWDIAAGGKHMRDGDALLRVVPKKYRMSLLDASLMGLVQMPFGERERWIAKLRESCAGDFVSAKGSIWMTGEFGLRRFKAGALFFDKLDEETEEIPCNELLDWIELLPSLSEEEKTARAFAETYWTLSHSYTANIIDSIIKKIVWFDLPAPKENCPGSPWLLSWKKRSDTTRIQELRLATLFLLIRAHFDRVTNGLKHLSEEAQKLIAAFDWDGGSFLQGIHDIVSKYFPNEKVVVDKLLDCINEIVDKDEQAWNPGPKRGELDFFNPPFITDQDVVKLLDPFPGDWKRPFTLDKSKKIGQALSRLKPTDEHPDFLISLLLQKDPDNTFLTPEELEASRKYSLEFAVPREYWPKWLLD